MVNKQEIVNVLANFSKFEEPRKKLIRGAAKPEQMNWSNIFISIAATVIFHSFACTGLFLSSDLALLSLGR